MRLAKLRGLQAAPFVSRGSPGNPRNDCLLIRFSGGRESYQYFLQSMFFGCSPNLCPQLLIPFVNEIGIVGRISYEVIHLSLKWWFARTRPRVFQDSLESCIL